MLMSMSALTDDELDPRPVPGWHLPTELVAFLAVLRQTPSLGRSDAARVEAFRRTPAFDEMPAALRDDLRRADLLG
jgi:hypothetical protein